MAPNLVVMEAEHFNGNTAQSGYTWQSDNQLWRLFGRQCPAGPAGRQYPYRHQLRRHQPTAGLSGELRQDRYSLRVDSRPRSFLGSDSLHVGLDGQEVASAARLSQLNPLGSWAWSKTTQGGTIATLNVTNPGIHIINVWMRESGTLLDKLVLTPNANYTPATWDRMKR